MNKKGVALIVTLLLSAVAMIIIGVLMELIISGTKMSGAVKQYTSALEAAKGGMEEFISYMGVNVYHKGMPSDNSSVCKIQQDVSNWDTSCSGYIKHVNYTIAELSSHSTVNDIINYYDWKQTFGNYDVYAKIVDARGSADGHWYYTVEIVSQNKNIPEQKAWLTVFLRTE